MVSERSERYKAYTEILTWIYVQHQLIAPGASPTIRTNVSDVITSRCHI